MSDKLRAKVSSASALRASYEQEKFTNVTFILVDDVKRMIQLKAHKCVLASRSPVFENWFYTRIPKKRNRYVLDENPLEFRPFLDYLYTEELKSTTLAGIFKMAVKYQVTLDINDFRDALCNHSTPRLFEVARTLGNNYQAYKDAIKDKIVDDPTKILTSTSPAFLNLSKDSLTQIMNLAELDFPIKHLFSVLNDWAQFQCGVQNIEVTTGNKRQLLAGILDMSAMFRSLVKRMSSQEFHDFILTGIYRDAISLETILELRNSPFNIRILHVNGAITTVSQIQTMITVGNLKTELYNQFGYPTERQLLVHQGQELVNENTLGDYGILDDTDIHFVWG